MNDYGMEMLEMVEMVEKTTNKDMSMMPLIVSTWAWCIVILAIVMYTSMDKLLPYVPPLCVYDSLMDDDDDQIDTLHMCDYPRYDYGNVGLLHNNASDDNEEEVFEYVNEYHYRDYRDYGDDDVGEANTQVADSRFYDEIQDTYNHNCEVYSDGIDEYLNNFGNRVLRFRPHTANIE